MNKTQPLPLKKLSLMGKSSKKPHKRGSEGQALEERGVPVIVGTLRKAWLLPGQVRKGSMRTEG